MSRARSPLEGDATSFSRVIRVDYNIRLEQLGGRPLAVVRRRAALPELAKVVPEACGVVWGFVRAGTIAGAGRNVALYRDDRINLEVGVEVDTPFLGHGEVIGSTTPAGVVATTAHFGPYGRLHEAHRAVCDWCIDRGHTLAGPNWEIYGHWTDEWNTNPDKIRTDVFYLLKADGAATDSVQP